MYLNKEEERIYEGEEGWTRKKAMEILVAIGDINDASRLISVTRAHLSGASYKTIGDAFEFISGLEGTVSVKSTLNPIGMDRERWNTMGLPEKFILKQKEVLTAYERLGVSLECTCIPYLIDHEPKRGEHLAWAESSAVLYANSVLGARTNMEGAPSALAAALIGKTPFYGLHLAESREPEIQVCVKYKPADVDYGALGFLIGNLIGDKIAMIELPPFSFPSKDELKHLSAAMGATGSVGMYHIKGVTSEADVLGLSCEEIEIERSDVRKFFEERTEDDVDVIAIGCPHCSALELHRICALLKAEGNRRKVRRDFFIFTSRAIKQRMPGVVKKIEEYGVKVICDTCFVISPAFERYNAVLTNSGKMLRYVPLLCGEAEVSLGKTEVCVRRAF